MAVMLTAQEAARAIGCPTRWLLDAARTLPAARSLGRVRIEHRHLGAYSAAWRAAQGKPERRAA